MVWWISKHKHSICNVFIFRVISFNAFWKLLSSEIWLRIFLGFVGSPGDFFGFWFLPPLNHPRHLKSGVRPLGKYVWCYLLKKTCSRSPLATWQRLQELEGWASEVGLIWWDWGKLLGPFFQFSQLGEPWSSAVDATIFSFFFLGSFSLYEILTGVRCSRNSRVFLSMDNQYFVIFFVYILDIPWKQNMHVFNRPCHGFRRHLDE